MLSIGTKTTDGQVYDFGIWISIDNHYWHVYTEKKNEPTTTATTTTTA